MSREEIENLVNTDFSKFQLVINRIYKEEYIKQLEEENKKLEEENDRLKILLGEISS